MQRNQQRRLKAVTGPNRVHDIYGGGLALNRARLSMPGLGAFDSAGNYDEACTSLDERLRFWRVVATAVQKFKVDVGHSNDVGDSSKRFHPVDVAGLVLDQIGPAVRIEGDGDRSSGIPDHGKRLGCALFVGERRRPDMDSFDFIEGNGAAPIGP